MGSGQTRTAANSRGVRVNHWLRLFDLNRILGGEQYKQHIKHAKQAVARNQRDGNDVQARRSEICGCHLVLSPSVKVFFQAFQTLTASLALQLSGFASTPAFPKPPPAPKRGAALAQALSPHALG